VSLEIVIPEWARCRIEAELGRLTEDVLRPALTEAGVPNPGHYVLAISKLPARRGCEHRTLVADMPAGHAPVMPECGCPL
jgi:hypothetical protein